MKDIDNRSGEKNQRRVERVANALAAVQGIAPEHKVFIPRIFLSFGLPHKRLSTNEYTRRNGDLEMSLVSKPGIGVPFGQDRLLPILIGSAFTALGFPENKIVCFRALQDVLDLFQIHDDGKSRMRVRDWFRRWSHTTVYCNRKIVTGRHIQEEFASYRLISKYQLWCDDQTPNQYTLFENFVQIDSDSATELRQHEVPLRLNLVRALKQAPGALDLSWWLDYRGYRLARTNKDNLILPVVGNGGLVQQLGCDIVQPKHIYQAVKRWFAAILAVWPQCPHELSADGKFIIVRAEMPRPMDLPKEFLKSIRRWEGNSPPSQATSGKDSYDSDVDNPDDKWRFR